jgi:hypothetical protein
MIPSKLLTMVLAATTIATPGSPQGDSGLYPAPEYDPSRPSALANPDGSVSSLPQEQTRSTGSLSGCSRYSAVGPIGGSWSTSGPGCSLFGMRSAKHTYSWQMQWFSNAKACVQGRGYNSRRAPYWAGIGCGSGGTYTVGWGEVISTTRVKVKSLSVVTNAPIWWS